MPSETYKRPVTSQQMQTSQTPSFQMPIQHSVDSWPSAYSAPYSQDSTTSREQLYAPQDEALLRTLLQQLMGPGTQQQQEERQRRDLALQNIYSLLGKVSPEAAKADAAGSVSLALQRIMEKNMPAISRAVEGAGMNTSTMQGVLSSQMARDASLAAQDAQARQEQAYAQQRSNLAQMLDPLTRPQASQSGEAVQLLNLLRGANRTTTTSQRSPSSNRSMGNPSVGSSGIGYTQRPSWELPTQLGLSGGQSPYPEDPSAYQGSLADWLMASDSPRTTYGSVRGNTLPSIYD